ncbi:MAG: hypothetical protein H0W83_02345 [Planctomycetes bacterium]|nr:hypothetical protein [Planctomycetota bacterium]
MREIVSFTLLLTFGATAMPAAELPADYRQGEEAILQGDIGTAGRIALRLRSGTDPDKMALGLVLAAEIAFKRGGPAAALLTLRPLEDQAERLGALDANVQLAVAKARAQAGDWAHALEICNSVGAAHTGMTRAHAAVAAADILSAMQQWDQALERLRLASAATWQADISHVEGDYSWEIEQKRRRIQGVLDINTHGAGFYWFVLAQRARLEAKDYSKARDAYGHLLDCAARNRDHITIVITSPDDPRIEQLPVAPVYEEAARFYHAACQMALANIADGSKELQAITAGTQSNHYYGESYRLLGDAALEFSGDALGAERCYTAAIAWFDDIRQHPLRGAAPQVPAQSQDATRPAATMRAKTDWGNTDWFQASPEQVYNSDTCPWYLSYQIMLAQTRRALCHFLNGKTQSAVNDLEIITATDPLDADLTAKCMPSNYRRLHDDFQQKRLYATVPELSQFSGKSLVAVALADFAFEMENWGDARTGYDRLLGAATKLPTGARAYLTYALAECDVFQGKRDEAKQRLAPFHAEFLGSPSWPRAIILEASLDPSSNRYTLLESVIAKYPNSEYSREALLKIGQNHFVCGENQLALQIFKRLQSEAAGTVYDHGASSYINYIHSQGNTP